MTSFFACLDLVTLVGPLSVLLDLITGCTPFLNAEVDCEGKLDIVFSSTRGDSAEWLLRFFLLAGCEPLSLLEWLGWEESEVLRFLLQVELDCRGSEVEALDGSLVKYSLRLIAERLPAELPPTPVVCLLLVVPLPRCCWQSVFLVCFSPESECLDKA